MTSLEISGFDEKDNAIIRLLIQDARASYSEIAQQVGLSRVAVRNRIKALEEKGIIKGYHAEVDPLVSPQMFSFIAILKTTAGAYEEICEMMRKESCVRSLCKLSGDNQLHAVCVAASMQEMRDFARRVRSCHEGVLSFSAQMVWEMLKGNVFENQECEK